MKKKKKKKKKRNKFLIGTRNINITNNYAAYI